MSLCVIAIGQFRFFVTHVVYFAAIFRFVLLYFGNMFGYKENLVLKPRVIPTVLANNSRHDKPVKITMAENKKTHGNK